MTSIGVHGCKPTVCLLQQQEKPNIVLSGDQLGDHSPASFPHSKFSCSGRWRFALLWAELATATSPSPILPTQSLGPLNTGTCPLHAEAAIPKPSCHLYVFFRVLKHFQATFERLWLLRHPAPPQDSCLGRVRGEDSQAGLFLPSMLCILQRGKAGGSPFPSPHPHRHTLKGYGLI